MARFLFTLLAPTVMSIAALVAFGRWVWVPALALAGAWLCIAALKASSRRLAAAAQAIEHPR